MSRAAALVCLSVLSGLSAQEIPPVLPPPPVPGTLAQPTIAPPVPGQLNAVPGEVPQPTPTEVTPPPPPTVGRVTPTASKTQPRAASTSTTGQFIVHGDDLSLRSAMSSKCEAISQELRTLLHDKEPWGLPIILLLNQNAAAKKNEKAVNTVISQLSHGGFHIQVTVNLRPDLRQTELRKEVIRALLAERILHGQKEIVTQRKLLLPDWLFMGILEATDYRQRARPSALFAAIFKSGKIFGIEEIIEASASEIDDSLSKTIYQTSCCALVLALLDQPDSGLRMGKFLNALASDSRSERELLNQWFPNFATSAASLNKWWALQLATLASPGFAEPLSPQDTVTALNEALMFRFQAKSSEVPEASRPTIAKVKPTVATSPTPAPRKAAAPAKEDPSVQAPATFETAEAPEEEKRGFMSRLNPFGKNNSSDDELAAAIQEAARAEAESSGAMTTLPAPIEARTADETPVPAQKGRKPLLNRFFNDEPEGSTKKEEAPAEKTTSPPAPKTEKKAASKPQEVAKPAPVIEPEAEKKPANLKLRNWFRKKDKEEVPEAPATPAAEPEKKASLRSPTSHWAQQLISGETIEIAIMQEVAAEADKPEAEKKRFFGIFGGKKKTEGDPAEPEAPKKVEPAPKKSAKPEVSPTPEPAKKEAATSPMPAVEVPKTESEKHTRQPLKLRLFGNDKEEEPTSPEAVPATPEMAPTVTPPEAESKPRAAPAKPKVQPSKAEKKEETNIAAAIPIEDYAAIIKRKDLAKIMERNVNSLNALQNRGAILFRPIITDYINALEDILKGKTRGMDTRLRELRSRTQRALDQSLAVRDQLDLHEANDTPSMSGLFEDYLKLPETIQSEVPQRTDPISRYLDALDKEFSTK